MTDLRPWVARRISIRDMGHTTPCWLWRGGPTSHGYAQAKPPGYRPTGAHRVSYEAHVGPIPDGREIDHLCRVRHCLNPAHLEAVTRSENVRRGLPYRRQTTAEREWPKRISKTHCPNGHEYTPQNTMWVDGGSHRRCAECRRAQWRKAYHKAERSRSVGNPVDSAGAGL